MRCIKCNVELILGKNWRESDKSNSRYICNKCADNCTMERRKTHQDEYREMLRKTSRERRAKLRIEIIQLLGGKCANPNCAVIGGMKDPRALQIDHANRASHGYFHERKIKGDEMYMKEILSLIKSGSKDYQCLCANCNWIKRYENSEHKKRI